MPIFEYDHIVPYSRVREHAAENLTLLCPNHHREKTLGLLPSLQVEEWNANSYCIKAGATGPLSLNYSCENMNLGVGSNYFDVRLSAAQRTVTALAVDTSQFLGVTVENGFPLLHLTTRSRSQGALLKISKGELVMRPQGAWDITFAGTKLTIRAAPREIDLSVWFVPDKSWLIIERGNLRLNRVEFTIDTQGILRCPQHDISFRYNRFQEGACIHVGPPDTVRPGYYSLGDVPRTAELE